VLIVVHWLAHEAEGSPTTVVVLVSLLQRRELFITHASHFFV